MVYFNNMKRCKTPVKYVFLALIVTMAGCENKKAVTVKTATALKVLTERAVPYNGLLTTSYSGVVEEKNSVSVSFLAAGTIEQLLVQEGQLIKKGELIARMNGTSARNTYQIALLEQQKAQDAYNRLKPMYENGTLPPVKMVEVETGLNQAKANTAIARKNWQETNLYAPSGGTIGKIHFSSGMNVAPGVPVLDLLSISTVYIKIPVPEDEISKIKKGVKASVSIPAIPIHAVGDVKEIGVSADVLSHTYPVKIEIANPRLLIKPGMVCSVTVSSTSLKTGFLVSGKALQKDVNGNQYVYVVDEKSIAIKRFVRTISLVEERVLIEGDIQQGDTIIIAGQEKLASQMAVEIIR
ncbi:efflux RND transporter periplasmic adaptor subunit [Spirosoma luteum]|uniref:efflux RND transporter periplasmic adaptor subunit n=1 Tax=Spirosoma luteum TaxID=431553 RepID=UPI0003A53F2F|nr:efflux RND transporter periplasmic adaptor subunit [Spirosoma luteum]